MMVILELLLQLLHSLSQLLGLTATLELETEMGEVSSN
jgi:hypothetical protein